MTFKERIFVVLCLLHFASFFLMRLLPPANPLSMGLLAAFSLFFMGTLREKLVLLRQRPQIPIMIAFAVWLLVSGVMSDNTSSTSRVLQLRLPLLVLPFSLGLVKISPILRNRILLGIASITTIGCAISFAFAVFKFNQTGLGFWLYNDSVSWLSGQQSIYTSLLVNLSIFIFAWFIFYNEQYKPRRWLFAAAILVLFIISYMLASRNMMALLYISVLGFCFIYLFRRKKYLEGSILLIGLLMGGLAITRLFPKTINRFRELTITKFDYQNNSGESHYDAALTDDQWNGANFRLAAWPLGVKVFRQHPLTGVGIGDKRDELTKAYQEKNFQFAIRTNKNIHNNYLDILMGSGLIGLMLFLSGWLAVPLVMFLRRRQFLPSIILLLFAIAMITESYFDRSIGSMLFCFFLLLPQLSLPPANQKSY